MPVVHGETRRLLDGTSGHGCPSPHTPSVYAYRPAEGRNVTRMSQRRALGTTPSNDARYPSSHFLKRVTWISSRPSSFYQKPWSPRERKTVVCAHFRKFRNWTMGTAYAYVISRCLLKLVSRCGLPQSPWTSATCCRNEPQGRNRFGGVPRHYLSTKNFAVAIS